MRTLKKLVAFGCSEADRIELKRVSTSLEVAESDVARAALRAGLRVVGDVGIRPIVEKAKPSAHVG